MSQEEILRRFIRRVQSMKDTDHNGEDNFASDFMVRGGGGISEGGGEHREVPSGGPRAGQGPPVVPHTRRGWLGVPQNRGGHPQNRGAVPIPGGYPNNRGMGP